MEKALISKLVLLMVFLMLHPSLQQFSSPDYVPRPLCQSQFILVNHACIPLPYSPGNPITPPDGPSDSPPSPSSPASPEDPLEYLTRNRRQRQRQEAPPQEEPPQESPVEQECCRWLKAVDTECVCDLLVHLPTFLSRPVHEYSVIVDETCNVTFACPSRIKL
ncbi:hypothetical protein LIER_28818 [Lithospermum erythrorhizon]|uniref:Bifunctional inhibitor/plant lipid transfer protein/seed storage helical domain-containing protein n=1 Tax=Lithospermum erythrorhizon TaxID=34254 RepID=A0AAV3RIP5_LITER